MTEWGRRPSFNARLTPWTPWAAGLLVAVLTLSLGKQAVRRYHIAMEEQTLREEYQRLQARRTELSELLRYVQTPTYTEEQARLKFGLARPGERLAVIPEVEPAANASQPPAEGNRGGNVSWLPNYQKWWRYFFSP